jgi:hypothetical protein
MRIVYGDYTFMAAIGGSAGGAAFLAPDDGSALFDTRTGSVQLMQWIGGTQNTSSYVELTITVASAIDATAIHGCIGIANVIDLPAGTKIVVDGVTQRLQADEFGKLNAWFTPSVSPSNTLTIRIYNDVNGSPTIPANAEFAIGEIGMGRSIDLCALMSSPISDDLSDPSAYSRTEGNQLYSNMRKPFRTLSETLGTFSKLDVRGGPNGSTVADGAGGFIDIKTLRARLAVSPICGVCLYSDDGDMQRNAMFARLTTPGAIQLGKVPRYTWNPSFQEAT